MPSRCPLWYLVMREPDGDDVYRTGSGLSARAFSQKGFKIECTVVSSTGWDTSSIRAN